MRKSSELLGNRIVDQDVIDLALKRELDSLDEFGAAEQQGMIMREVGGQGGSCPVCNTPWKHIDVDIKAFEGTPDERQLARFFYYDPACSCFPRCPRCKKSMHRFARPRSSAGDYTCPSCGWKVQQTYRVSCVKRWKGCQFAFTFHGDHWPTYEERVCPECAGRKRRKKVQDEDFEI